MDARPTLDDMIRWFESLTRETTGQVPRYYADDAYFRDPFNEVHSAAAIERIYAHMFDQVEGPRFRVTQRWHGEDGTVLAWDFTFRMRGAARTELVQGLTHLRFGLDGRIVFHRDYWDAAGELYERIPLLGGFMRVLKGRLRTP